LDRARVRVLAATAPGLLPRLATGCGEAIVMAFDPRTREYTAKALALYSPPQTKIPEVAVVAPPRDGNEEICSRGWARSSESAKAAGEAKRRAAELYKQVGKAAGSDEARQKESQGGDRQGSCLRGKCRRCRRRTVGALLRQLERQKNKQMNNPFCYSLTRRSKVQVLSTRARNNDTWDRRRIVNNMR
jgi:hypothetical protein